MKHGKRECKSCNNDYVTAWLVQQTRDRGILPSRKWEASQGSPDLHSGPQSGSDQVVALKPHLDALQRVRLTGVLLFAVALVSFFLGGLTIPTFIPAGTSAAHWFDILTWSVQSLDKLGMGFLAMALLLVLLSFVAPELKQLDVRVHAPRVLKRVSLVGAVSGLLFFAVLAFADVISIGNANLDLLGPLVLHNFYVAHVIDLNHTPGPFNINVIGENATVALSVAILFMFVYRLEQGALTALSKAITLFAAPAVMVFEIGLLLFGPATMSLQATNILIGSPLAAILTNWFLLVISSGLFAMGLARRKHWLGFEGP